MKIRIYITILLTLCIASNAIAQLDNFFNGVYPITDNPNVCWKSKLVSSETILFEANPTVRFAFFNNIRERFENTDKHGETLYALYKPQLRMYSDTSVPVKMPSYRILLGFQQAWKLKHNNIFAYSIESGHYSDGQSGSTFSTVYRDGSPQSDSVIATIGPNSNLSKMLNRTDGEFSTDMTEVMINYRINRKFLADDCLPHSILSFKAGVTYFHNQFLFVLPFGGFAKNLIPIYGRWRFLGSIEYMYLRDNGQTITFSENMEIIQGAHPFVDPIRIEGTINYFLRKNFGIFATIACGHDNYNIRMVDSGVQCGFGFVWQGCGAFSIKPCDK